MKVPSNIADGVSPYKSLAQHGASARLKAAWKNPIRDDRPITNPFVTETKFSKTRDAVPGKEDGLK